MDNATLPLLSASELARLIERKEVSPVEVTDAYLQRIETLMAAITPISPSAMMRRVKPLVKPSAMSSRGITGDPCTAFPLR